MILIVKERKSKAEKEEKKVDDTYRERDEKEIQ